MMEPKYKSHITVVRYEPCIANNIQAWEGKEVKFEYCNVIQTNDKHFWLGVKSDVLTDIRVGLGLSAQPEIPFHLTIGVLPGTEESGL